MALSAIVPRVGGPSPWGPIQTLQVLASGIISVSTASHGGIWLSPAREEDVPTYLRRIARQYAPAQWYEEDCDVAIVAHIFGIELRTMHREFVEACEKYFDSDKRFHPAGLPADEAAQ